MGAAWLMRKIGSVVLGAVLASFLFFLVATLDNALRPLAREGVASGSPEAVAQRVATTPTSKWLAVLFGLALGSFVGGGLGALVAKDKTIWVTAAIGLMLSPWAFYTFYVVYPDVLWVPIGMFLSVFLFSHLGGKLSKRIH